jgi:hypothetical protein
LQEKETQYFNIAVTIITLHARDKNMLAAMARYQRLLAQDQPSVGILGHIVGEEFGFVGSDGRDATTTNE